MIEVRRTDGEISIKGHAGYAEPGRDKIKNIYLLYFVVCYKIEASSLYTIFLITVYKESGMWI